MGHTRMALSVVEGNEAALSFYGRIGGEVFGRSVDPRSIWSLANIVIAWDDLDASLQRVPSAKPSGNK